MLPFEMITGYRSRMFRTAPGLALKSSEEAIRFVDDSGYIFFWPISGITLPSLWAAAAGDRPVADAHDDPGHVTWSWKDELLDKHVWYYGRVLRRRNTIISLAEIPYFYALSPNYGDPDQDYLEQYENGHLTREAKILYEAILHDGPLDTLALRRKANLAGLGSESKFARALDDLQIDLRIIPVGIARVGGWRYAFIYDIVSRHFPDLSKRAHNITESEARQNIIHHYLQMTGAIQTQDIAKLFNWPITTVSKTLDDLTSQGAIHLDVEFSDQPGKWVLLNKLI